MPNQTKRKTRIARQASAKTPVPAQLENIQKWFASIITQPLINNEFSQPNTPQGNALITEAEEFLIPSPTLAPHERIQIYNQQYWWRLLNVLHDHFPLLSRLFGHWDFDEIIGVPYLCAYPPDTWSLYPLGKKLPYWLKKNYNEPDKKLVLQAAEIDCAFQLGFIAKQSPPLSLLNTSADGVYELAQKPLKLQPHIKLFKCTGHYFNFRDEFLEQEVEYWLENDFPKLSKEGPYYFVVFRNIHARMDWQEISDGQYFLLKQFQKNASLVEACQKLETVGGKLYEDAFRHIQEWFHNWTASHWLTFGRAPQAKKISISVI